MNSIVYRLFQVIFYGCLLCSVLIFAINVFIAVTESDFEEIFVGFFLGLGIALVGWTLRFIATGQKTFKD